MGFQVSPGVQVKEIDATNVIPAVSTSIGGFVGAFSWGPADVAVTVGSENELAKKFGTPNTSNNKYFLTATGFLKYGNNLKVVRAVNASHLNAASGTPAQIKNKDQFDQMTQAAKDAFGEFAVRYPGALGNSIEVHYCLSANDTSEFTSWAYSDEFDSAPGTSEYILGLTASNELTSFGDEFHVIVVDAKGLITGTEGALLEKFAYLSVCSDAKKSDGTSLFWKEVINNTSQYIYACETDSNWKDGTDTLDAGDAYRDNLTLTETEMRAYADTSSSNVTGEWDISGGVDGTNILGDFSSAWDVLSDAETIDVSLLFAHPEDADDSVTFANNLLSIAMKRKDVVAFTSPPVSITTTNATSPAEDVKDWADLLTSTSYGVTDSTALYVYDKYNDAYVWISAAGHTAGLCANADLVADPWWSPAGYTRGQYFGVSKLGFNPTQADRDTLYKARINPIVSFPGQGTILYGDKTLQSKPSAFDRINVRRLFIVLEKAISTAAKYQLFEFNDEFTRAMFRNMTEPFLRNVKGRRGITDFLVVCDTSNNTGEIIDTNQFVADIYVKPARSINFITLNFVATRTGVSFSEIAG